MRTSMQVIYTLIGIIFLWLANVTLCLADEATIQIGEKLYNQNCVFCHQADGYASIFINDYAGNDRTYTGRYRSLFTPVWS